MRTGNFTKLISAAALSISLMAGMSTIGHANDALLGGLLGGAAGAGIGGAFGGAKGAAIGGAAGLGFGALFGHTLNKRRRAPAPVQGYYNPPPQAYRPSYYSPPPIRGFTPGYQPAYTGYNPAPMAPAVQPTTMTRMNCTQGEISHNVNGRLIKGTATFCRDNASGQWYRLN